MKIIQSGQKYLEILGVSPNQSLVNVNFFLTIIVIATDVGENLIFIFHEADTFLEYANNIFVTTTVTMIAIGFVIGSVKIKRVCALIDLAEKRIEQRE